MRPAVRIVFAPIRNRTRGLLVLGESEGRTIRIDPRGKDLVRVLLHELLHVRYPKWSERRVRSEESQRWKRMTWKAKARLLKLLATGSLERE